MNQITSTLLKIFFLLSIYGCSAQSGNSIKPAKVVTKAKTSQELRIEARQIRQVALKKTYSFIQLNGKKIHYRDEGLGPVLVLIHGMGSNLKQWNNYIDFFMKDFRVISMDLPGGKYGQSEALFTMSKTDSLAYFVSVLMDELNIDKAHVAGSSLGGAIAIQLAALYPQRVSRLILISAAQTHNPAVKTIKAPTLIIWGDNDRLTPLDQAHILQKSIEGSELIIYEGGGHVPTNSHTKDITAAIASFLSDH